MRLKKALVLALAVVIMVSGFGGFNNTYAGTLTATVTAVNGNRLEIDYSSFMLGTHATYGAQTVVQPGDTVTFGRLELFDPLGFPIDMSGNFIQIQVMGANSITTGLVDVNAPSAPAGMLVVPFTTFAGSTLGIAADETAGMVVISVTILDGTMTPIADLNTSFGLGVMDRGQQVVQDTDGQVPIELNVEAMTMLIALPRKLPVSINKTGDTVTLSGSVSVQNLSSGSVRVNEVSIIPQNGFVLKAFDRAYMKAQRVGTQEFGMKLGFEQETYMREFVEGTNLAGVDVNVTPMGVMDFKSIFYDFTLPPQSASIVNGTPGLVVFDINFNTN